MTLVLEATKEIVGREPQQDPGSLDRLGREPFLNNQLASVDNLSLLGPKDIVGKEKLHALARSVGMLDVVRWKPRLVRHG